MLTPLGPSCQTTTSLLIPLRLTTRDSRSPVFLWKTFRPSFFVTFSYFGSRISVMQQLTACCWLAHTRAINRPSRARQLPTHALDNQNATSHLCQSLRLSARHVEAIKGDFSAQPRGTPEHKRQLSASFKRLNFHDTFPRPTTLPLDINPFWFRLGGWVMEFSNQAN